MTIEEKRHRLEFKIAFCETNLRWLEGEPQSEQTRSRIELNKQAIQDSYDELGETLARPFIAGTAQLTLRSVNA